MPFNPLTDPPEHLAAAPALIVSVAPGGAVLVSEGRPPGNAIFLGVLDDRHAWAVDATEDPDFEPDDGGHQDLRGLWGRLDEETWTVAGRGVQLVEWLRTHRFCGRCATPTEPAPGERALRCPACALMAFPRLAPAVITLIERDDGRILLARGRAFPIPMYSLLAGFVEPGETLEEAVARESLEEVGVHVTDITYWGSQPWPFPHSLMIGFRARYAGGDLVLQESEIVDANWYEPDALPLIPPNMSIAGRMIELWLAEKV